MDRRTLKEILAAHADQLIEGKATDKGSLEFLAKGDKDLVPLLDVAEQIQSTLQHIQPANDFENRLRQELVSRAQLQQAEGYTPPNPTRDLFVLLATAGFIISLTIALLALRHRQQQVSKR